MLLTATPPRLHWDAEHGWLLDVDTALPPPAIDKVVRWALPRQIDRWRGLMPGDRKEQLAAAIKLLEERKVRQVIRTDAQGQATAFQATERMNKGKSFHYEPRPKTKKK